MVKLLVLSLDRDDDLGVKTGIRSPVVGREAVLQAATQLALKDPTEADANTLFGSVKVYDDLRAQSVEVEVAALTGDPRVGIESDRKVAAQVDEVLRKLSPEGVLLVTDGADDEFLLPILQSRVKVDGVHRVVVVQSEALEGAYYQLKKALDDPRFARKIFIPLGLIFVLWGTFLGFGRPDLAGVAVLLFLGGYSLVRGLGWGAAMEDSIRSFEEALQEGYFSFLLYLAALVIAILGTIVGYTDTLDLLSVRDTILLYSDVRPESLILMSRFVSSAIAWYAGATLLALTGHIIRRLVDEKEVWRSITAVFYSLAGAFLLGGISHYLLSKAGVIPETTGVALRGLTFSIAGSVLLVVMGFWLGRFQKKMGEALPLTA